VRQPPVHPEKRFLSQLLAARRVARRPGDQAEDHIPVSLDEVPERFLVSTLAPFHQLAVAELCHQPP